MEPADLVSSERTLPFGWLFFTVVSLGRGGKLALLVSGYKGIHPDHEDFTLMIKSTPQTPHPITLGIRLSTYKFQRNTNIQIIAPATGFLISRSMHYMSGHRKEAIFMAYVFNCNVLVA